MKGFAREHICITHGRKQQCGDGGREGGGALWRRANGEGAYRDICNIIKYKNKEKKRMNRQATQWEKIFSNHISSKDLYPEYINKTQQK